jgi:hypothetical protein
MFQSTSVGEIGVVLRVSLLILSLVCAKAVTKREVETKSSWKVCMIEDVPKFVSPKKQKGTAFGTLEKLCA